jgi:endonuclease/exonuclease/phosphatase family metal-dependent hydrolase
MNYDDPLGPKYEGGFAEDKPDFRGTIKVVTYNINQGLEVEQAIEEIHAYEALRDPDILLLQEMDEEGTQKMARALGHNYVYYPASVFHWTKRDFGNAILTKWSLSEPHKVLLPHRGLVKKQLRIAVRATVALNGMEISTYSVHTETYTIPSPQRKAQISAIVNDIGNGSGRVIAGGDFNTISNRSIKRMARQFSEVDLVRTTAGLGPTINILGLRPVALDHIFARGLTALAAGKVITTKASDHFPVWVDLGLHPQSQPGGLGQ